MKDRVLTEVTEDATRTPVPGGSCEVWWADASAAGQHLLALLDESERARRERLRSPRAKAVYLVSHALARLVVGARANVPAQAVRFDRTCLRCGCSRGKPRLTGSDVQFSISRSKDVVVVAVTTGVPVGVDVEHTELRGNDVPGRALDEREREFLDGLPPARRVAAFIRYWTRKEAVLKATGDGLSVSPARAVVSSPGTRAALLTWRADRPLPGHVELDDLETPSPGDYLASVAFVGARPRLVTRQGDHLLADPGGIDHDPHSTDQQGQPEIAGTRR